MGRWAQSRRRQSAPPANAAAGPPPAPVIAFTVPGIVQTAMGGDDTGGIVELQFSEDAGASWDQWNTGAWAAVVNWPDTNWVAGTLWRAKEVGNGVAYVGDSNWSNVLVS